MMTGSTPLSPARSRAHDACTYSPKRVGHAPRATTTAAAVFDADGVLLLDGGRRILDLRHQPRPVCGGGSRLTLAIVRWSCSRPRSGGRTRRPGPAATMWPRWRMASRSATWKTSFMLCEMSSTPTPRSARPAHELEHHGRLGHAQGGRRLVHDHQPGVPQHRLGDGHGLALATGERGHRLADRAHRGDRQAGQGVAGGQISMDSSSSRTWRVRSRPRNRFWTMSRLSHRARSWNTVSIPSAAASAGGADVDRRALPQDLPAIGGVDATDALDQHRLAGAVVAGQGGDLPGRHHHVDVGEGLHRAEVLVEAAQLEQWHVQRISAAAHGGSFPLRTGPDGLGPHPHARRMQPDRP